MSKDAWEEAYSGDDGPHVLWLLEPRRSVEVKRWNGTMAHANESDKVSRTINAFIHFAYVASQQTLLFADVQSK